EHKRERRAKRLRHGRGSPQDSGVGAPTPGAGGAAHHGPRNTDKYSSRGLAKAVQNARAAGGSEAQPRTRSTRPETSSIPKTTRRKTTGSRRPKRATPAPNPASAGSANAAATSAVSRVSSPAHQ